jgi:hypothetical protein
MAANMYRVGGKCIYNGKAWKSRCPAYRGGISLDHSIDFDE